MNGVVQEGRNRSCYHSGNHFVSVCTGDFARGGGVKRCRAEQSSQSVRGCGRGRSSDRRPKQMNERFDQINIRRTVQCEGAEKCIKGRTSQSMLRCGGGRSSGRWLNTMNGWRTVRCERIKAPSRSAGAQSMRKRRPENSSLRLRSLVIRASMTPSGCWSATPRTASLRNTRRLHPLTSHVLAARSLRCDPNC